MLENPQPGTIRSSQILQLFSSYADNCMKLPLLNMINYFHFTAFILVATALAMSHNKMGE